MVLDKIRKGLRPEPPIVAQLRTHQWTTDAQRKDLIEKFLALENPELEDLTWTATDPQPDIRSAGLSLLKRRPDTRAALDALVPSLRTRSEAVRRAVQRFIQEIAGAELTPFLQDLSVTGDDFARLAVLELARNLPSETAFGIFKKILSDPNPRLRARALRAVSDAQLPGTSALAATLALPLLQDEDEEIRLSALTVLERNPSEALITHVIDLARSGSPRVIEAAFAALKQLLPTAQADHTAEILPLMADGNAAVRGGAVGLVEKLPPDFLARKFLETFHGAFSWVRDRALDTAVKGLPTFLPALLRLTQDLTPATAHAAAEMTLNVTDARAVPVWIGLLQHPDWWIKHRTLEALGKYGRGQEVVFPHLLAGLQDAEMCLSAASALGDFADPRAAGPLFDAFKLAVERPDDQLEMLDAMGRLGAVEPRVGNVLAKISTLTNLDMRVREKASRLVGRLQGEDARKALPAIVSAVAVDLSVVSGTQLVDFLLDTVNRHASDFHIATGFVPHRRMNGTLEPLEMPTVTREQATQWIREVLTDAEWQTLQHDRQLDTCLKIKGLGRFRANFFSQRCGFDASFRVVPNEIPSLHEIGLPEHVWDVARFTQGLVLVTGPAGCGKSTTLAAILDRVNESRRGHIITIEDPVEFVHTNKECLVNQRQVPHHTVSFSRALRAALREDPDVILIGEMRDLETISLAISASETGHLVLGTLHTTSAGATIDRIINAFPPGQQSQIRAMIADSIKAVITQALLPRAGGHGRIAAFEILRGTPAVSALIRESKTFQIPSALQTGQLSGMNTMDQALLKLAEEGKVDLEAALDRAVKKEPFEKILSEERLAIA